MVIPKKMHGNQCFWVIFSLQGSYSVAFNAKIIFSSGRVIIVELQNRVTCCDVTNRVNSSDYLIVI